MPTGILDYVTLINLALKVLSYKHFIVLCQSIKDYLLQTLDCPQTSLNLRNFEFPKLFFCFILRHNILHVMLHTLIKCAKNASAMHMRPGQAISAIDSAFILMALQSEIHNTCSLQGVSIS